MAEEGGLLVVFDEEQRKALIHDRSSRGAKFSEALSVPDWEPRKAELALLLFDGEHLDFVALARRGKKVTTAKSKVNFRNQIALDSLSLSSLGAVAPVLKNHVILASRGIGGRIPAEPWARAMAEIKRLRPGSRAEIERLERLAEMAGTSPEGMQADLWMQEREAVGAATEIFAGIGFRTEVLESFTVTGQQGSKPIPFLNGLSRRYIDEESALQHDLMNFPGMTTAHTIGRSTFTQGNRKLQLLYANGNDVERTLGVDLIYYTAQYAAFVLIQYKLMTNGNSRKFEYRPDAQFDDELDRMHEFARKYIKSGIESHWDERLNADGFFIKFVPNEGFELGNGELIRGKYITREYAKFLISSIGPKGPRGGRLLSWDGIERHLSNTEFCALVRGAWVGTRGTSSAAIETLIRNWDRTGRCLYVAHEN
jgi:hypothetical protein